jgi:hypothetical protein
MSSIEDYQSIIRRAVEDPDFRERLTENPAGTWEEVTGTPVPEDVDLIVLEDSSQAVHLVLPDPSLTVGDLEDLSVTGGGSPNTASRSRLNPDLGRFCCADITPEIYDLTSR